MTNVPLDEELICEVADAMNAVVMDDGADIPSNGVRTLLDELGIEVQYRPRNKPEPPKGRTA